ncbi:3-oxoacyl-[acyl-carrier-protein] synthase [Paragonimus heterotremus]|uniref:beta-ketoacyl-[acyl-carrier-protein] synthase I n=1 Tax=Paragonimus heterotremus TaxID=100268 RepID=A0A8J4SNB2_9TREM|nr:3-oxoacyl-[acyl-carrier-protein] synthase [Paragonimus heterotremus]
MNPARRVVITGMGVCSPIGNSIEHFWSNLLRGVSGIGSLSDDYSFLPCRIGGVISSDAYASSLDQTKTYLAQHKCAVDMRFLSRASSFAIFAAQEALTQAGWKPTPLNNRLTAVSSRAGVHFGTGMSGIEEIVRTAESINARLYRGIGPYALTRSLPNMPAGIINRIWGLRGPCMAGNTACATGLHAIGDAYRMIQYGEVDLMLAGGCEASICPWGVASFARIHALSTKYNDCPTEASRPFDVSRDGFAMSEGAGAMVLQAWPPPPELTEYCGSSVKPIAEVIGYGRSGDAYNLVSPEPGGDGAYRSMANALKDAGVQDLNQVGHVNCHATSTPVGDEIELTAVSRLLATYADRPRDRSRPPIIINSIKGHTGHLLGAAGAVESIYTALSVNRGQVVGNCNLHTPISKADVEQVLQEHGSQSGVCNIQDCVDALETQALLPLHEQPQLAFPEDPQRRRIALTNSFGFGGTNGSLVIAEWKE